MPLDTTIATYRCNRCGWLIIPREDMIVQDHGLPTYTCPNQSCRSIVFLTTENEVSVPKSDEVPKTEQPKQHNPINHPVHYNSHPSGIECIQIAEHMNFNLGNALKYIWRADLKNGIEDMRKAIWYIEREIARRSLEQQA